MVLIGYVILSFWLLLLLWAGIQKKCNKHFVIGFLELILVYVAVNHALFAEMLLEKSSYASHREEIIRQSLPFFQTVWNVFWNSSQHVDSLHQYLVFPILLMLIVNAIAYRRMEKAQQTRARMGFWGMLLLLGIAVFYGLCESEPVIAFQNAQKGFLHSFQACRYYWFYPAGWYLEYVLCLLPWWDHEGRGWWTQKWVKTLAAILFLLPTIHLVLYNSYFYLNVNQINNGSAITGYISWESFYAEDLMEKLDLAIGKEKSGYRIAHLGVSPAPALMHGFYTVDGYSNNYPLEYKHRFRRVIEDELANAPATRAYFDEWGSRCYLFNSQTGYYYMLKKGNQAHYKGLAFHLDALKELGCEYLFVGAQIEDYQEMGLDFMGYYETENSYWGIWLYGLR